MASERELLVARGRRDGRPIVIVPEVKDGEATGITLLHVRFADRLPVATARGMLQGYRNRYAVLRDAVLETEQTFREDLLADIPVDVLLDRADQPARRPLAHVTITARPLPPTVFFAVLVARATRTGGEIDGDGVHGRG